MPFKPANRVSICFEIKNFRDCRILSLDEAKFLRKHIESCGGVVYWFNPHE